MIDFIGFANDPNVSYLKGSELVSALRDLDNNLELKAHIKSLIPTIYENGEVLIDPKFQNFILQLDVIKVAEDILGIEKHSKESDSDEALGMSLFVGAIKEAFLSVINESTLDFSAEKVSWERYIEGIHSLGFKEIARSVYTPNFSDRKEDFILFFNYQHSMLWSISSSTFSNKKVGDSNIAFAGEFRNPELEIPLNLSMMAIPPSNYFQFEINMMKMPTHIFFELLTHIKPVEKWGVFNLFERKIHELMPYVPFKARSLMLDYNIMSYKTEPVINDLRNALVITDAVTIMDKMTKEQQIYFSLFIKAQFFADKCTRLMPDFIADLLEPYKTDKIRYQYLLSSLIYYSRLFYDKIKNLEQNGTYFNAMVEYLEKADLVDLYDTFKDMEEGFKDFYFSDVLKTIFDKKMAGK